MPNEDSIPVRYTLDIVDRGAWIYFIQNKQGTFDVQRTEPANGLVIYTQGFRRTNRPLGEIQLHHYDANLTIAIARVVDDLRAIEFGKAVQGSIRHEAFRFTQWLDEDVRQKRHWASEAVIDLQQAGDVLTLDQIDLSLPRLPGRPPNSINAFVRAALEEGQDQSKVLADYLALQGVDPHDQEQVRKARDRFRKIVGLWSRK